jgi:folate-binding protein YgfZ
MSDAARTNPGPPTFLVDRSERARLWITGPDRARFLHNLCTQDVLGLPAGSGCEAFLTNLQGRTLAYVTVHALDDALLVRTDGGGLDPVMPHLRQYGIFDDVTLDDRTPATSEWHLAGPGAEAALSGLEPQPDSLPSLGIGRLAVDADPVLEIRDDPYGRHAGLSIEAAIHQHVLVIRESPFGREGWTVIESVGPGSHWAERLSCLDPAPIRLSSLDPGLEGLRILAGTPKNGQDVTSANLPQEIDRNAVAINFTKGCYLGQETVARLDALGHVNKLLRRLSIEGAALPPPGALVRSGEREVGTITSVGRAPDGGVVALAILRVKEANVGATVEVVDDTGTRRARVEALLAAQKGTAN